MTLDLFGHKKFSSWENIIQMNIYWKFETLLLPWPWILQSNIFKSFYNTLAYIDTTVPIQVCVCMCVWGGGGRGAFILETKNIRGGGRG